MRLVVSTNYYDFCNSWDTDRYIEYSSAEQFYIDFCEWCNKPRTEKEERDGFLGLELYKIHITGDEQHSAIKIYTYEEWWEKKFTNVKGE